MDNIIQPRLYRGMRDIDPADMEIREKILRTIQQLFKRFGFSPLATPAIEYIDILAGKYGEDSEKLFYNLAYEDGKTLALRYDLTVPLARYISMHAQELPKIFKRYQIQTVWRAERAQPKKGRFREFLQCDVDIIGSNSLIADAEIIALSMECLNALGFENYILKINHRVLLKGLLKGIEIPENATMAVCRIIDKMDKISPEGVKDQLAKFGLSHEQIEKLFLYFDLEGKNEEKLSLIKKMKLNDMIEFGADELIQLFGYLQSFGLDTGCLDFEPGLARGLDYYTGAIFETILPEFPHIGSLTGGGRYDDLVGIFTGREIPACGTTVGLDRIVTALKEARINTEITSTNKVLVANLDDSLIRHSIELATSLRNAGIDIDLFPKVESIRYQLAYANKLDIKYVLIIGKDEYERNSVSLKNMMSGEQQEIPLTELIDKLKTLTKES